MSAASDVRDANPKIKGVETTKKPNWRRILGGALAVAGVALAAFLLHRIFREYSWQEFQSALASAPKMRLAAAFGFAAASYLCLTLFDWMATRYAGFPMPWRRAAHASFTALSLGHNIGFAALSSGAVRYRFYTRWGMSREGVAKVILFCGATVALGLLTLIGFTFLVRAADAATITGLSEGAAMACGATALALCAAWLLCAAFIRRPLHIRRWSFTFPPLRLALGQIVVGSVNFAFVAACLHQAIRAFAEVSYPSVATAYVLANGASLVSHVPGGLGIIESVIVYLVPGASLIAALIVFRATYFFIPFVFGLFTVAITELFWRTRRAKT
ncbi:MAG: lysylphosphatidylglycerol synthase domain-containing protein [Beijerinckiaceae bacterium]|nr:lysylphosphatidylglycerol synthase domain-containing protein [Beijerinckiaceae bacterium]